MTDRPPANWWWHTIELPDGTVTPGHQDYRGEAGKRFLLPADLAGKSVIDFGTWDGFWAIEAKKRGAKEVLAVDKWRDLETAKKALGAYGVPYLWSGDLDYPLYHPEWSERFDVVLFYGILYHLKNPYMGLFNAASCCKPGGLVIVESAANQGKVANLPEVPLLWVVDTKKGYQGDHGIYFLPNIAGVLQLCWMVGLEPTNQTAFELGRFTVVCRKESQ